MYRTAAINNHLLQCSFPPNYEPFIKIIQPERIFFPAMYHIQICSFDIKSNARKNDLANVIEG